MTWPRIPAIPRPCPASLSLHVRQYPSLHLPPGIRHAGHCPTPSPNRMWPKHANLWLQVLPLVSREWRNGSNSSYICTPFLHSLLTKLTDRAQTGTSDLSRFRTSSQTSIDWALNRTSFFPGCNPKAHEHFTVWPRICSNILWQVSCTIFQDTAAEKERERERERESLRQ